MMGDKNEKPSGPPRERLWEFLNTISLLCIAISIGLGVVYSVSFFQDSTVMAMPLQAAAQSFVLFAVRPPFPPSSGPLH